MSKPPVPSETTRRAFEYVARSTAGMMEFALHGKVPELQRKRVVSEGFLDLHKFMQERLRVQIIDEPWREDYQCMADDVKAVGEDLAKQAAHDALMLEEPMTPARH